MKIKLTVLDQDRNYVERLSAYLGAKYVDKLEVYAFTDQALCLESLAKEKIDVFLASQDFTLDFNTLPPKTCFAYLVETPNAKSSDGYPAISKYQKLEALYKQVLSLFAENTSKKLKFTASSSSSKLIICTSPAGGLGNSTVAAAISARFATLGKKVLYLNLEDFGSSASFFRGEGNSDFSEIIFALKSKRDNLALRIESTVRQDAKSSVSFFEAPALALDFLELSKKEILTLVNQISLLGSYDYIVADLDFSLANLDLLGEAKHILMLSDGLANSNLKLARALASLGILDQKEELGILARTWIMYNRFSNKTGQELSLAGVKKLGGAPRYQFEHEEAVFAELQKLASFDNLMD